MKEKELKMKLEEVKKNNYNLKKDESYFKLSTIMMENIGALDPELRDDLIYDIFCKWILEKRLTKEDLEFLLKLALDDSHLFYKLLEKEEDAVYTRSFSMLSIALIIYVHREESFLKKEVVFEVKDKILDYMYKEEDLRGYVKERGWAHSMAHGADVLDELANCTCLVEKDLIEILYCIKEKMTTSSYVYIEEENERMVNAVESVLNRNLIREEAILNWLGDFQLQGNSHIEKLHSKVNTKSFLRSLYFRLIDTSEYEAIKVKIKNILKNF